MSIIITIKINKQISNRMLLQINNKINNNKIYNNKMNLKLIQFKLYQININIKDLNNKQILFMITIITKKYLKKVLKN